MASGSNSTELTSTGNGGKTTLSISWTENSTSVSNNTSNITVTAKMAYKSAKWDVTNSGTLYAYWHDNKDNTDVWVAEISFNELGYNNNTRTASATINRTHKDDGTLSGYAFARWTQKSSYGGYAPSSGDCRAPSSGSTALTTIARKSSPTVSPASITIPATSGTVTVTTNRKSNSFTHTITLKVGNTTIATKTGVGASTTFNIADIDDAICATIPSANSTTVTVNCETFNGSTSIGSNTTSFTANVGDLAKPTFTAFSYSDTNSTTTAITGNNQFLISGKSTLTATISTTQKAVANYSATMSTYTFAINGASSSQAYSTSAITKNLGTVTLSASETSNTVKALVVTAVDSRGKNKQVSKDITVLPYKNPVVNASATRLNGFEDSTTISVGGTFSILSVNGTSKNTVNTSSGVKYRYKAQSTSTWGSWTNLTATVNTSTGAVTVSNFTLSLDNQTSYDFQFSITDKLATTTVSIVVPVGQPAFWVGSDNRICVGGMPTKTKGVGDTGLLEVKGSYYGKEGIFGVNIAVSDDTTTGWKNQFGNGRFTIWYSETGKFAGQPSQYGFLETIIQGSEVSQWWYTQSGGEIKRRSGNGSGWSSNVFRSVSPMPIGSIFESTTYTTAAQVNTNLGGAWELVDDPQIVAFAALSAETTIAKSKNISSITGSGGTYKCNFSKNMADTNYVAFVSGEVGGRANEIIGVYGKTTSGFSYDFSTYSGGAATPSQINIVVIGKLATPEKYVFKRTS